MHCKPLLLLFGVVVTTLLSIVWLSQTLITPSEDDRLYYSTMGELPLALSELTPRSENTHTRGNLLQFSQRSILSDQDKNGTEWQPMQVEVQRRETLHITADGQQKRYQQDEYGVLQDSYAESDIKSENKEAWLDFENSNTTERELDRTSSLSQDRVVVLRNGWEEKGRLVGVEDPIPTIMSEDANKGTLLLGTEIIEEAVTSSKQVGRDAVQSTRETSPQLRKGGNLQISPSTPDSFASGKAFSLPVPFATLPLGRILQTQWLKELRDYLSTLKPHSGPITLVSSDYKYREVLLNWLISALVRVDRPLSNVLVLSLDPSLYSLLRGRGFACIYIPSESLLSPALTASLTRHVAFTQVHVLRLTVMRFLNHWGFDVANYDTDAIIMKNPELLYYQQYAGSDFIGSYGHFPQELQREWGIAVCIGVAMIKSSIHTEQYWEVMSQVLPEATNDQAKLNLALKAMNIKWSDGADGLRRPILREAWQGSGRGGFTATVLPSIVVCRRECSRNLRSFYYIWHKGGMQTRDGKRKYAAGAGLWYLRSDWMAVSNSTAAHGHQWLKAIAH